VAHSLGEVVGLGLRNLANCPVEMNLMPDSTLRWQSFNQKKPYLIATVVFMVMVTVAVGILFGKLAGNKSAEIDRLNPQVEDLSRKLEAYKQVYGRLQRTQNEAGQIAGWMQQRYYWGDFLAEMRRALIRSEDDIKKKLSAQKPGVEVGIWIEQITSAAASSSAPGVSGAPPPNMPGIEVAPGMRGLPGLPGLRMRGESIRGEMPPPPAPTPADQTGQAAAGAGNANTNTITLICRAVSLTSVDSSANTSIAYAVENEIKSSPLVDPKATQLSPNISPDDPNGTFSFSVNVALLNPLKF
jgi:hypothetical protein